MGGRRVWLLGPSSSRSPGRPGQDRAACAISRSLAGSRSCPALPRGPAGWGSAGCWHLHPTSRSEQARPAEGPSLGFQGSEGSGPALGRWWWDGFTPTPAATPGPIGKAATNWGLWGQPRAASLPWRHGGGDSKGRHLAAQGDPRYTEGSSPSRGQGCSWVRVGERPRVGPQSRKEVPYPGLSQPPPL